MTRTKDDTPARRVSRAALLLALAVTCAARPVHGQALFGSGGLEALFGHDEGIQGGACSPTTAVGYVASVSRVFGRHADIAATIHPHPWEIPSAAACTTSPEPPRPDGTYVRRLRDALLARSFVAADLRLRARLGTIRQAPVVSVGAGAFLRSGRNLPYGVAGVTLPFPIGAAALELRAEYYYARVRIERREETWQSFMVVSSRDLDAEYRWSRAFSAGMGIAFPLRISTTRP